MISTENLTKKYDSVYAVKDLNLNVNSGEILCLLGANGAGKSTTINMLLNFVAPTSGKALIYGMDVSTHPQKTKEYLTYIPENLMLYPTLTAVENLDYFTNLSGKSYTKDQLKGYLNQAGLQQEAHHRRIKTFSKGMRQKVGVALAIARQTKALLLDEPTSGLDPKSSNEFSQLLLSMKDSGVATLMATHDLFTAKSIATHIAIMRDGQLQRITAADDISLGDLERLYLEIMNYQNI